MPISTIKAFIDANLPSANEIPMTVLRMVLKAMLDDLYGEHGDAVFTQEIYDYIYDIPVHEANSHPISFITNLQTTLNTFATITYVNNLIDTLEVEMTVPENSFLIWKYPGNTILDTIEQYDKIEGFWDNTKFLILATFEGGDNTDLADFTIHDELTV